MSWKELFKFKPGKFILVVLLHLTGGISEVGVAYVLTLQFNAIRKHHLELFLIYALVQLILYVYVYLAY